MRNGRLTYTPYTSPARMGDIPSGTTELSFGSLKYSINYQQVQLASYVETNCNSFILLNQGQTTAIIDGVFTIAPGESLSTPGEVLEMCVHKFNIAFQGSGVNRLIIIRKYYI